MSWQLDEADLAVVEMTSVAFDWLASGKPLVMVQPHEPQAEVLEGGLMDLCPTVGSTGEADVVDAIAEAVAQAGSVAAIAQLYLGDTSPGAQMARFIRSSEQVIAQRVEEHRLKHLV